MLCSGGGVPATAEHHRDLEGATRCTRLQCRAQRQGERGESGGHCGAGQTESRHGPHHTVEVGSSCLCI